MLLGMGVFFTLGALLALLIWLTTGSWHALLREIALVAALATVPVAYYLWGHYVIQRL